MTLWWPPIPTRKTSFYEEEKAQKEENPGNKEKNAELGFRMKKSIAKKQDTETAEFYTCITLRFHKSAGSSTPSPPVRGQGDSRT